MSKGKLLVLASSDFERDFLRHVLEKDGFEIVIASSLEDAFKVIDDGKIRAVIAAQNWIANEDDSSTGLVESLKDKLPMLCIMRTRYLPDFYRSHYISSPIDVDDLRAFVNRLLE